MAALIGSVCKLPGTGGGIDLPGGTPQAPQALLEPEYLHWSLALVMRWDRHRRQAHPRKKETSHEP